MDAERLNRSDEGYATPAAAVISLAIATVVAVVSTRSFAELRLAKADYAKMQAEYALAAAQNAAMLVISTSSRPPPYRWTQAALGQAYEVVAEPERPKMSTAAFAGLPETTYSALGVADSAPVRGRLSAMRLAHRLGWIADQASAQAWRDCAPALVSPFGAATVLQAPVYGQPEAGKQPALWRSGEVWRISVTDSAGWREERIIRFTGDGLSPAAVIGRRVSRLSTGGDRCARIFDDISGA